MKKIALIAVALVFSALVAAYFFSGDDGTPLVCDQYSSGVKYAKLCGNVDLERVGGAHKWVAANVPAVLSKTAFAGISSFIEETGRSKSTIFYQRISSGDLVGACNAMMSHVNTRGEIDKRKLKRREREKEMCLSDR